jgi:hypothetical protein
MERVLGIDVGFSERKRTTGLCLLTVEGSYVRDIQLRRVKTDCDSRSRELLELIPRGTHLAMLAVDGPLIPGLSYDANIRYRQAERLLSQGELLRKHCKPGQSSSPTGRSLHKHATALACLVLKLQDKGCLLVVPAAHNERLCEYAVVEAFPNAFLAVLLPEKWFERAGKVSRTNRSDRYWEATLEECDSLPRLFSALGLDWVSVRDRLAKINNHDERAALVCAMTALAVARRRYCAVGCSADGWIILPPLSAWGLAADSIEPWAKRALENGIPMGGEAEVKYYPCD